MTNVVSRDGYNIPSITYDGSLTATSVTIGDAEDFARLKEQVAKSGIFILRRTDPTQADSFFFAMIETPTSIFGYRLYNTQAVTSVLFVSISLPTSTPNEMKYSGVNKSITTT